MMNNQKILKERKQFSLFDEVKNTKNRDEIIQRYQLSENPFIFSEDDFIPTPFDEVDKKFLDPSNDYNISGSQVVFTTAPAANDDIVMIALAAAADLTRTVNYVIDSGSLPMQVGDKGKLTIDVTGVIENIRVLSDQTGDIVFDISKTTFADYPNFNSITAGQRIQLSNSDKYFDDVLNNWTTTITAGEILRFDVISVNTIRRLLISLKLKL